MRQRFFSVIVLSLALLLLLTGCSSFPFTDTKALMAPPKSDEDQQAIHRLLQGGQQEINLVFPRTGDYRSAILMQDFTGDGLKDAIGFTSLPEGGVQVQFLRKAGEEWQTVSSFPNSALQVDRVLFARLTDDGIPGVLIGWGSTTGATGRTASVSVYLYDPGEDAMGEYPLGVYGELTVTDLNADGLDEVFTVDKAVAAEGEGEEASPAQAKVYAWQDGAMALRWTAPASNDTASFSQLLFARLNSSTEGVVLDGATADGSMTTQVFCLEENKLVNYPAAEGDNIPNYTLRPSGAPVLCRDIDGDGLLDIPMVSLLPCLPEDLSPDSTSYQVEWVAFSRQGPGLLRQTALMNLGEGYSFRLPLTLKGQITAQNDPGRRSVVYTQVTGSETGEQLLGSPLFAIRAFTKATWESRGASSGYEQLTAQGDTVYGILVYTADPVILESIDKIRQQFQLLSE